MSFFSSSSSLGFIPAFILSNFSSELGELSLMNSGEPAISYSFPQKGGACIVSSNGL
jgi:hypothetical protein